MKIIPTYKMPEVPDIEMFTSNLNKLFAGKKIEKVKVINQNKLKDTPKELITNRQGKPIIEDTSQEKECSISLAMIHSLRMRLMLTGDVFEIQSAG